MKTSDTQTFWMTMRTLWFALTVSHLLLAFVLWFVRFGPSGEPAAGGPVDLFVMVFGPLAVMQGGLSLFMPRWQLRQAAKRAGVAGGRLSGEQLWRLRPAAQTALILGMALSESVTLLGFVLGFLGARPVQFVPFFAAGFLLAAHRFPGEGWLRGQIGASDDVL